MTTPKIDATFAAELNAIIMDENLAPRDRLQRINARLLLSSKPSEEQLFEYAREHDVFGSTQPLCPIWYATELRREGWMARAKLSLAPEPTVEVEIRSSTELISKLEALGHDKVVQILHDHVEATTPPLSPDLLLPNRVTVEQWAMIIDALEYQAGMEAGQSQAPDLFKTEDTAEWELAQQLRAAHP